jgi:quercetin dioxygenase-like cupin family protein
VDDTPSDLEIFPGYQRMMDELRQAEIARRAGNEGRARVCARRAAGIAAGEYLNLLGIQTPGQSAYDHLLHLYEIDNISPLIRSLTGHFFERVSEDFSLPVEIDLIADARQLAAELFGGLPVNGRAALSPQSSKRGLMDMSDPSNPERTMPPPYMFFTDLSREVPDVPSDSIISRTIYTDDQVKAILFRFSQGQELSEHTASVPAIIHILEGNAHLKLGADSFDAGAGSWAHMQANLSHSVYANTPTTILLLMLRQK